MSQPRPTSKSNPNTRTSPLVESLLSGDRAGIGGIACNDMNGLCLVSRGNMDGSKSGVYTNLVRLASKLQQNYQQTTKGQPNSSLGGTNINNNAAAAGSSSSSSTGAASTTLTNGTVSNASSLVPTANTAVSGGAAAASESSKEQQPTSTEASSSSSSSSNRVRKNYEAPLITIEMDTTSLLIKEYDGYSVAIRVPTLVAKNNDSKTTP